MGEVCHVFDATNEKYNVLMYYVKMKNCLMQNIKDGNDKMTR
jgi:hypothetical protein